MKKITLFFTMLCLTALSFGQIVNIPDANFKNALLNHVPVIDTDNDGEIQESEAAAFTGAMDVSNKNISDLTGIEAFTALTGLNCNHNQLTHLDISHNTALEILGCQYNQLTTLDLSNNTALAHLQCDNNQLTTLDLSNNTALESLQGYSNQLTALDLSNNTALKILNINENQLTTLDLSNNTALESLNAIVNQLTNLNIGNNQVLNFLLLRYNQLTYLDVSNNTALTVISVRNNQLTNLNIANTNNSNVTYFDAQENPDLFCIQVDAGIVGSIPSSWQYDTGMTFSDNCVLHIPDPGFRDALLNHDPVIDTNGDGVIQSSEAEDFAGIIDVSDGASGFRSTITDLTGIKAFYNATGLWAHGNGLTNVDLRNNAFLTEIRLEDNQLKNLSVANGNNANLTVLNITNNPDLACVEVDENMVGNIPAGWQYDAGVSFNATCALSTEEFTTARVVMYPNPANAVVTIQSQSEIKNITVFDLHGKQAISQSGNTFDVSALKSGIYLVRIVAENSVSVQKLVVK